MTSARWERMSALLALALVVGLLIAPPHSLLDKADHVAFAVCHRLPERTFMIAGRPLPLCARCSGMYLGAVAGLGVLLLRGRGRAGRLPARRYMAVFAAFFGAWAVDGVNSFLGFFPGLPHLYEPGNLLRLATGTLQGLVIAALALPGFNLSLWAHPTPEPSVGCWRDLAGLLLGGAAVVGLVSSGWPALLVPLALLSGLAVVLLIGAVNMLGVLLLLRRSGCVTSWREAASLLLIGVALGMLELAGVGTARMALETWLGPVS